jgi:hypothetical protein
MINANATSKHYGRVVKLDRSRDGSLNIQVLLESGHLVEELGFVYHKTVAIGDLVAVTIGSSIMSDRYGVRHVSIVTKRNKLYSRIETRVNRQGYYTALRHNIKGA